MTDADRAALFETALRAVLTADDLDHARLVAEAGLAKVGLVPRYVGRRTAFTVAQHRRGARSNVLRGIAALTELVELVGVEGATDPDAARIVVENELELRELRWFAMGRLTTGGEQK